MENVYKRETLKISVAKNFKAYARKVVSLCTVYESLGER